jgi:hypothetical protein
VTSTKLPTRATLVLLVAAVAVAAAGCGNDATGPGLQLTVAITVTQLDGPNVSDVNPTEQRVQCGVHLRAVATGEGRATWLEATLLFYGGPDRGTALDSIAIPQTDIQQSWGKTDIGAGETQESGWSISASIPFGGALVYRYQPPSGGVRSTQVAFNCGPDIPVSPPAPTLSSVTVEPSGTEVEPGNALTVHYIAASDLGLWTSGVRASGACTVEQSFSERFVRRAERIVSLVIGPACAIGSSLSLTVFATDAALQSVTSKGLRAFTVVDRTPPQVYVDHMPAATQYVFAGDTLRPFIAGLDNHSVRSVVWEVQPGGVRDSVLGGGGRFIEIPIRPEWAGSRIHVRFFARDASGLVSDTLVLPIEGVPIYPTVTRPTRWAAFAGDIQDLAYDAPRGALYLMQGLGGARIGVFSLASLALIETIPLPVLAWDMDLTAGGDSLILALPYLRALGIIDLRQPTRTVTLLRLQSLDTTTQQAPWGVRVGANGKAYVKLDGPAPALAGVLEVDLVTKVERLLTGAGNVWGAGYERSFDRSVLIFRRGTELLQRYDVALDAFGPIHEPRSIYGALRVDGTGARITLGLDVYDTNLDFLRRVASVYGGEAIPGSALSKDGEYLYHALGNRGVGRTRTSDGTVVDRVTTPVPASGYLRISPDGNTLIVMDSFAGTAKIALIDLR